MNSQTNLLNQKLDLIQWLTALEDMEILKKVEELKQFHAKDWWKDISTAEKESILNGVKSANQEELVPHELVRKKYEKWL